MKHLLSNIEWRSEILNIAAMIISLIFLAISLYFYLDSHEKLDAVGIELQNQISVNREAKNAKNLLDSHTIDFATLKNQGVIGNAQRLQWIELTERISTALSILLVDFTLGKTNSANEAATAYINDNLSVAVTDMDFEISLRHEGEFYKFMESLRLNAKGLFSVDDCRILRNQAALGTNPDFAGLSAKCHVEWYSIEDVSNDWELAQQ